MSYILEALKKSQVERELGRVPTLDTSGVFEEDKAPPARSPWPLVAVGLAALATLIALYAALRGPAQVPVDPRPGPARIAQAGPAMDQAGPAMDQAGARPADAGSPPPGLQDLTRPGAGQEGPMVQTPRAILPAVDRPVGQATPPLAAPPAATEGASEEPLVEPPPPKRSLRALPPGSQGSLAYPGDGTTGPSHPGAETDPDAALDADLEADLQRQLEAESDAVPEVEEVAEYPAPTPVPRDLIADIEAFKRQVRDGPAAPPTPARPGPDLDKDPTRLRLTLDQEADLPAYLMTVHVYDREKPKRFVVINGVKYREADKTREGLTVERIIAEGAVLSYQGNPFFVQR